MMSLIFPKIDLKNIKGVLIDIDNTLYAYDPAHKYALQECFKLISDSEEKKLFVNFDSFSSAYRRQRTEVTKRLSPQGACRSRLFAFQAMLEERSVLGAYTKAFEFEKTYWESLINFIKPDLEAKSLLEECNKRGVKVCALTDMQSHFQVQKLKALGLIGLIDFFTSSEEVGEEKPSGLMFQSALRKLGMSADEVIMVGDSQVKDIEGAQREGIKAYKVEVIDENTIS